MTTHDGFTSFFQIDKKPEEFPQASFCEWLKLHYPPVFEFLVKIDNNANGYSLKYQKGKRISLDIGACDIFIAWPTLKYYGIFLEIKPDGWQAPRNKKEEERFHMQAFFLDKMRKKGYAADFAIGIDQCILLTEKYLAHAL